MNNLTVGLIITVGILGGFYVGAKYGQGHPLATSTAAVTATPNGGGRAGGAGGFGGGGTAGGGGFAPAAAGQITAIDGNTITVHDRTTDKDVKINVGGARITKTTQGTAGDLTADETVTVVGQVGPDGTVTAQQIAIGNGQGGGRGARPQPSPSG